jgi:2-methylisocitrate lyase-like PEP mutase family enzyme
MIQLEDQTFPKRCGHLDGKSVVTVAEMAGKIDAALDARVHSGTLILARTDAIAVEGLEATLDRAESYLARGADALFIEAVRSPEQMDQVCGRFAARVPLLVNLVEGGKTPMEPVPALQARGFRIAIFPGGTARAVAHALQRYYASLRWHGSTLPFRDAMLDFDGLNAVIGTPELMASGKRYEPGEA